MKRVVLPTLAGLVVLAAMVPATVSARAERGIILPKVDQAFNYRGIVCVGRATTPASIVCASPENPFKITIGQQNVVVLDHAGRVLFKRSPTKPSTRGITKAEAAHAIALKPSDRLKFRGISCVTRHATYNVLVCFGSPPGGVPKYAVSIGRTIIVVTSEKDGRVLFQRS